jgi:hypothetical protein
MGISPNVNPGITAPLQKYDKFGARFNTKRKPTGDKKFVVSGCTSTIVYPSPWTLFITFEYKKRGRISSPS